MTRSTDKRVFVLMLKALASIGAVFVIFFLYVFVSKAYEPSPGEQMRRRLVEANEQIETLRVGLDILREQKRETLAEKRNRMRTLIVQAADAPSSKTLSKIAADDEVRALEERIREQNKALAETLSEVEEIKTNAQQRRAALTEELKTLIAEAESSLQADTAVQSRIKETAAEIDALEDVLAGGRRVVARELPSTNVTVMSVQTRPLRDYLTLPASVEAHKDIFLAAKNDGTVEWLGPGEGDRIEKDAPIARIDAEVQLQNVRSARANAELAKISFDRLKNLVERGAASQGELDEAESKWKQAEAALAITEQNYRDATLLSPISGIVDEIVPDVGEFVNRGETVARIVDVSTVKIQVSVPEKDVGYFDVGETAEIENPAPLEGVVEGRIMRIAAVAEAPSRTFRLEVETPNPDMTFRPGMITRARLVRRATQDAIVVPVFAVAQTEDGPMVYVANGAKAHVRPVRLGVRQGMQVQILEGLAPGDQLIVEGQRSLSDGAPVKIVGEREDQ